MYREPLPLHPAMLVLTTFAKLFAKQTDQTLLGDKFPASMKSLQPDTLKAWK